MNDIDNRNGLPPEINGMAQLPPMGEVGARLSPEARRARFLMSADVEIAAVFSGPDFPPFQLPAWLQEVVGPCTVTVTFYNFSYQEVTRADEPGRYGAVFEIHPASGRPTRRYRTLYRGVDIASFWRDYLPATLELPPDLNVEPTIVKRQEQAVSNYVKGLILSDMRRTSVTAALLAGLHEIPAATPERGQNDDPIAGDRRWWVGLKRQLDDTDQKFSEPFRGPRSRKSDMLPSVPELRDGSPVEAGVQPGAPTQLDALCQEWADNSDEGFTVCVVRNSVVFFQGAYGTRQGQPMTLATRSYFASITKLLAGCLVAMLVDGDRISLDAPIYEYLPAFVNCTMSKPLTLRHLMTHTAGLWDHLGDNMHDFDQRVADYAFCLEVGKRFEYNGASLALAGKVMEMVSGEALPDFYRHHLLAPLGLSRTEVTTMSWNTFAPVRDIAVIGQMLLNGGSYGDLRFFGEKAYRELLPQPIARTLGIVSDIEYGLGTEWFRDEGLGNGVFGHSAHSDSTLRIAPETGLVVVMARNAGGANFSSYHPRFLRLVGESVAAAKR